MEESTEQKNMNVFQLFDMFGLLDYAYDLFCVFKYT